MRAVAGDGQWVGIGARVRRSASVYNAGEMSRSNASDHKHMRAIFPEPKSDKQTLERRAHDEIRREGGVRFSTRQLFGVDVEACRPWRMKRSSGFRCEVIISHGPRPSFKMSGIFAPDSRRFALSSKVFVTYPSSCRNETSDHLLSHTPPHSHSRHWTVIFDDSHHL